MLREKLGIYLQTPKKVETYAKACEKFFKAGNGEKLNFKLTWSWWAFFGGFFFFLYRKDYKMALIVFIVVYFSGLFYSSMQKFLCLLLDYGCYQLILKMYYFTYLILCIILAIYAKYTICSRFVKILKTQDDKDLEAEGMPNKLTFYFLALIITINSGRIFNFIF